MGEGVGECLGSKSCDPVDCNNVKLGEKCDDCPIQGFHYEGADGKMVCQASDGRGICLNGICEEVISCELPETAPNMYQYGDAPSLSMCNDFYCDAPYITDVTCAEGYGGSQVSVDVSPSGCVDFTLSGCNVVECQIPETQEGYKMEPTLSTLFDCFAHQGGCDNPNVENVECADGFELKATATKPGASQCTVANPVSLLTGCTRTCTLPDKQEGYKLDSSSKLKDCTADDCTTKSTIENVECADGYNFFADDVKEVSWTTCTDTDPTITLVGCERKCKLADTNEGYKIPSDTDWTYCTVADCSTKDMDLECANGGGTVKASCTESEPTIVFTGCNKEGDASSASLLALFALVSALLAL